jgi:hypothetical protein
MEALVYKSTVANVNGIKVNKQWQLKATEPNK